MLIHHVYYQELEHLLDELVLGCSVGCYEFDHRRLVMQGRADFHVWKGSIGRISGIDRKLISLNQLKHFLEKLIGLCMSGLFRISSTVTSIFCNRHIIIFWTEPTHHWFRNYSSKEDRRVFSYTHYVTVAFNYDIGLPDLASLL